MNKGIFFSLLIIFSAQIFAGSEISLGGPGEALELSTQQSIFREVVSYEPYESTCYREVSNGTRSECTTVYETKCVKVPYSCEQVPSEMCSEVPDTRTESYSCTEYQKVVTNEYDYSVSASITMIKNTNAQDFDLNSCQIGVVLTAIGENYYAYCQSAIVKFKVVDRSEQQNGKNKERKIKLALDFSSLEDLYALQNGLTNLSFAKGILTFNAANLETAKNFRLNLKLIRNRFLFKDVTLLNQELKSGDFTSKDLSNGRFLISVNLVKLAPTFDSARKNTVSLNLKTVKAVDVTGAINQPDLTNALNASLVIKEK